MTRHDENALVHAWVAWRAGREVKDDSYIDFFDAQIRNNPRFASMHVFEVLDVLVNAEPDRHPRSVSANPSRRESA
jgi:hypothetical protein